MLFIDMKTTTLWLCCVHTALFKKRVEMIQSFGRYLSLFRELSLIYYILCLLGSSPVAAQQSHSMCVYMEIDFITYLLKGDTWVASKNTFRSSYRSQFFFLQKTDLFKLKKAGQQQHSTPTRVFSQL